ncbi:unnamed protein product, partial [Rotaria sp. Silwood2]
GRYSLHLAVHTNNLNIVRYLVEQTSISLNIKDHLNKTPYEYALELSQHDIANYLLDKNNQITLNKNIEIVTKIDSNEQINNEDNISSLNLEQNLLPYLLSISTDD